MATLILCNTEGQRLVTEEMPAQRRFELYHLCQTNDLLTCAGKRYRVLTVAWRIPEQECVCHVTFDSWAPEPAGAGL